MWVMASVKQLMKSCRKLTICIYKHKNLQLYYMRNWNKPTMTKVVSVNSTDFTKINSCLEILFCTTNLITTHIFYCRTIFKRWSIGIQLKGTHIRPYFLNALVLYFSMRNAYSCLLISVLPDHIILADCKNCYCWFR